MTGSNTDLGEAGTAGALGLALSLGEFKPAVNYHGRLGWIEFIAADAPSVPSYINEGLELLLHSEKKHLIGVRLKGFLPDVLTKITEQFGVAPGEPLALKTLIELLRRGPGAARSDPEINRTYNRVRAFLGNASLTSEAWDTGSSPQSAQT